MRSDEREMGRLVDEILASTMSEEQVRDRYPDVIQWFNEHISLVDLMREAGVELKPISRDAPGVFIGQCPFCSSGPLLVRSAT
jgi:hypothetical protein